MPAPSRHTPRGVVPVAYHPLSAERALMNNGYTAGRSLAALARDDINTFCEYVLRDDETAKPLVQAPMHERWHDLIDNNRKTIIWSFVESGKSIQIGVAEPAWRLGRDHNLRILIVGKTESQAQKTLSSLATLIVSPRYRDVFPDVVPSRPWNSDALQIVRHAQSTARDYSIQAVGLHGAILGARLDIVILDDILTMENTQTEGQMRDTIDWLTKVVFGRLTRRAKVMWIGNAWHPKDAMHFFAAQPDWVFERTPVVDKDGKLAWPEQWDDKRLEAKKVELVTTEEYERQMKCNARDDKSSRFKEAWIARCKALGEGKSLRHNLSFVPEGFHIYTGVDLGVKAVRRNGKKSDKTVLFTIAVHPRNKRRELLWIESGRWSAPEIVRRLVQTHKNFQSILVVESNAAQSYIAQWLVEGTSIPVITHETGGNKTNVAFGVESLAVEMSQGMWIIPSRNGIVDPEVEDWIRDMLYYNPNGHTGDHLMAAWIAREAARQQAGNDPEYGNIPLVGSR